MSSRNSGRIIQMADGRKAVFRYQQPLLMEKGKVVLYLIDDEFRPIVGEDQKQKTILMDVKAFKEAIPTWKAIGMFD